MNRTALACYALIASAFMLGALLLHHLNQRGVDLTSTAEAELIVDRDDLSVLTAKTTEDEEALFILDRSGRLLVYKVDLARDRLTLAAREDLSRLFGAANR
jgi:hypothetical protein